MEQTGSQWGCKQRGDVVAPGALPENRDAVRVAAELGNVVGNPLQRRNEIKGGKTRRCVFWFLGLVPASRLGWRVDVESEAVLRTDHQTRLQAFVLVSPVRELRAPWRELNRFTPAVPTRSGLRCPPTVLARGRSPIGKTPPYMGTVVRHQADHLALPDTADRRRRPRHLVVVFTA